MTFQTVYVDMDDVLCETAQHFLTILAREFGKQFSFEQLTDFDVGQACALTLQEREGLYRIVHHAEELLSIAPIEGAVDVLGHWAEAGYEIAIVTGRPPDTYGPSIEWLKRYRVPYDSFLMVDKYGRFAADGTRCISLEALTKHRFSWAVEDSPTMAMYLASEMKIPVALFDRPWNRHCLEHEVVDRYSHWNDIGMALPAKNTCEVS